MRAEFDVNRKQDLMESCQEYFWAKLYIEFLPVNWVTGTENIDFKLNSRVKGRQECEFKVE